MDTRSAIARLILRELETGPATVEDIANAIDNKIATIRVLCTRLHKEKKIHISGYELSVHNYTRIFALGSRRDSPKPKQTSSESGKRYRARHRERINARRRKKRMTVVQRVGGQHGNMHSQEAEHRL